MSAMVVVSLAGRGEAGVRWSRVMSRDEHTADFPISVPLVVCTVRRCAKQQKYRVLWPVGVCGGSLYTSWYSQSLIHIQVLSRVIWHESASPPHSQSSLRSLRNICADFHRAPTCEEMDPPYDVRLVFVQKITFVFRKINKNCCHQSCTF